MRAIAELERRPELGRRGVLRDPNKVKILGRVDLRRGDTSLDTPLLGELGNPAKELEDQGTLIKVGDQRRRLDWFARLFPKVLSYIPYAEFGAYLGIGQVAGSFIKDKVMRDRPTLSKGVKYINFEDRKNYVQRYLEERLDPFEIALKARYHETRDLRYLDTMFRDALGLGASYAGESYTSGVINYILKSTVGLFLADFTLTGLYRRSEKLMLRRLDRRKEKIKELDSPERIVREFSRDIRIAVKQSALDEHHKRHKDYGVPSEIDTLTPMIVEGLRRRKAAFDDLRKNRPDEFKIAFAAAVKLERLDYMIDHHNFIKIRRELKERGITVDDMIAVRKRIREQEAYEFDNSIGKYVPAGQIRRSRHSTTFI